MTLSVAAGGSATAAFVDSIATLGVVKPTDESLTSNTTMQNDNDLVLAVAASTIYEFTCYLSYTAASGDDLKWVWQGPSGAFLRYCALHNEGGTTGLSNSNVNYGIASVVVAEGSGTGSGTVVFMHGTLRTGTTAGNLQLQWAQNVSSGSSTTVKQDSHLILRPIG